jgi:ribose transport system ATP-binding protein
MPDVHLSPARSGASHDAPGGVPAIKVRAGRKVYGATVALADAELEVRGGEIHALLGENGAGKSTLVRLLAGVEAADGGSLELFGEPISDGVTGSAERGCAFIHQDLALFPTLSVSTNIGLGGGFRRRAGLIDDRAMEAAAQELLDRLGLACRATDLVGELPLADQTGVAIARALSGGVRLIVLDEPTAYLEARQVQSLLALLRRLRDEGIACLLITHRAADVLTTCDRVTVLREGRTVAQRPVDGLDEDELIRLISGHAPTKAANRRRRASRSDVVLELDEISGRGFGPVSVTIGAGEIVAACGLADAGTASIGEVAFGITQPTAGSLRLDGRPMRFSDPWEAVEAGVAYVPAERRAAGLAETLSARENIFMQGMGRGLSTRGARDERRRSRELMREFGVQPSDPERAMTTFSGGNQQKVVLAKWLERRPRLLVLNEPTAGVDLGAKAEIHRLVAAACAERGLGVLLISSDFAEVSELADRVYVMYRRRVFAEIGAEQATADRLVALAYGRNEL